MFVIKCFVSALYCLMLVSKCFVMHCTAFCLFQIVLLSALYCLMLVSKCFVIHCTALCSFQNVLLCIVLL